MAERKLPIERAVALGQFAKEVQTEMHEQRAVRGPDDEYCEWYPQDGHHYISHSVSAAPIKWVERCAFCGHISSASLRQQLIEGEAKVAEIQADPAQPHYGG